MICAEQQEQERGLQASVIVCPGWRWELILVMAIPRNGERLEAMGGPDEFQRLRAEVRSWGLVPRIEQRTLARLSGLEREYRVWRASQLNNGRRSSVNWAFVTVMLLALVFWPLAIYGAWKLLGW